MRAAPAVSCAQMHKKTHTSIQVQRRQSGFPCAAVYGLLRALLGDRAFLPPSPAISRELDASVGASGPHGFAVRIGSRSSCASFRVHCIPPRVRDDRDPPLSSGETGEAKELICPTAKAEYFSRKGLTRFLKIRSDLPGGLFCRSRVARLRLRARRSSWQLQFYLGRALTLRRLSAFLMLGLARSGPTGRSNDFRCWE